MRFADIIGQEEAVARLNAFCDLYSASGRALEHILLGGRRRNRQGHDSPRTS
jgi:hypothetical protein